MSKRDELFNHKEPSPHHNRFFFYWAVWIIRHRSLAFSLSVMIALISISLIIPAAMLPAQLADIRQSILGHSGLMVDTSVDAFSDPNNDSVEVLERYRDLFGRDDYFMVLIEGDVFSMPYLEKLQKLHFELEGLNIQIASLGERRGDLQRKAKGQS